MYHMCEFLTALIIFSGVTGKIQGVVRDAETNEPLPYVSVMIVNTEIGTSTDEKGRFFILHVLPGKYALEISSVGYQPLFLEEVTVVIDQTVRISVALVPAPIEIEPIIVRYERPIVTKDMTSATYTLPRSEIDILPFDFAVDLIGFQPGVVRLDTSLHVRGGRATEVNYLIDNVSIIDPQTGDPAIAMSKGIIDEIIFLPSGFDVEYGRAMSGVINVITERPAEEIGLKVRAKTEKIMPFYYDFGYQNLQATIYLPGSDHARGFVAADIMHTDDWNPKLFLLPHKERDDYSIYGKYVLSPSGKFAVTLSTVWSRSQFNRYNTLFKYHLDHWRSDMRHGDIQACNIDVLPDTKKHIRITLSRLYTQRMYGVRLPQPYGLLDNFAFVDYESLLYPRGGSDNPFGIDNNLVYCAGDYPEFQDKRTRVLKAHVKMTFQVHPYHELRLGGEYTHNDLNNFTFMLLDSLQSASDPYHYTPVEYAVYIQDNIDYRGLYAKVGCRYDYLNIDIANVEPKQIISPRFGFSFNVTEKFLFRTNVGRYVQPPLFDRIYRYHNLLPSLIIDFMLNSFLRFRNDLGQPAEFPDEQKMAEYFYLMNYLHPLSYLHPLRGNPELEPERTISYEIGLQGEIREGVQSTFNAFYKDVTDLIGMKYIQAVPRSYVSYFNIEFANVRGIETIIEYYRRPFSGKVSYTLSWVQGGSYYEEVPDSLSGIQDAPVKPQLREYYLDFDQRHRVFVQGAVALPWASTMYIFGHIGQGFPYTPPGPEGQYEERNILRLPFQRQIDCALTKTIRGQSSTFMFIAEIINVLDLRYQIAPHMPVGSIDSIVPDDFRDYTEITDRLYSPAADLNHDGLITPREDYIAYRDLLLDTDDWVNAYTAPRRARVGIMVRW